MCWVHSVATYAIDGTRDHGYEICLARARATDKGNRDHCGSPSSMLHSYRLDPVRKDDPDWARCSYADTVFVGAYDAREARKILQRKHFSR